MKRKKIKPSFDEEKKFWKKGYDFIIGVDEVGRGAFAGPVTVGAVVFYKDISCPSGILAEINDSKLLSSRKRETLSPEIKKHALYYSTASIDVLTINKVGIGRSTQMAFRKVLRQAQDKLGNVKLFVLIDGFHLRYIKGIGLKNQKAIIKGDQKSISIAAASIIAKVHRDNLMRKLHKKLPAYKFAKNKGYGTKEHRNAIKKHGLSKVHRTSFALKKFTYDSCAFA